MEVDAGDPLAMEPAIISKGNVQLQSDDVEKTVFDVQALVDKYGGEVTDLGDAGMVILSVQDPDDINLELAALKG